MSVRQRTRKLASFGLVTPLILRDLCPTVMVSVRWQSELSPVWNSEPFYSVPFCLIMRCWSVHSSESMKTRLVGYGLFFLAQQLFVRMRA